MELHEQMARLLASDEHDELDFAYDEEQSASLSKDKLSNDKVTVQTGRPKRKWRALNWRDLVAVALIVGVVCGASGYSLGFWAMSSPDRMLHSDIAPLRIMVAGDSISQGSESMHTWRYRLWKWFQANNVPVVFVGPFHRTQQEAPDLSTGVPLPAARSGNEIDGPSAAMDSGYALDVEAEFLRTGSAHFAIWGRQIAQDLDIVSQQIREHSPDYLLIELGFNDLAWVARQPNETLFLMKQFIDRARATSPELRFAVANVPQRSRIGDLDVRTREYNEMLRDAIPKWSQPSSLVALVKFMEEYSCGQNSCPASLDGIHPNSRGEFEIARAFSRSLHQNFGLGKKALALPSGFPNRTCLAPETIVAYPSKEHIRFAWDFVYGANGYDVEVRRGGGVDWVADSTANYTKERHLDAPWTVDGKLWEFRVRTYCEETVKSPWTQAVSATVQ